MKAVKKPHKSYSGMKLRSGVFYVQAMNPQKGRQDETSLRTSKEGEATTRKNRFCTILAETKSWVAAKEDLLGKKIIRAGESPDYEQMIQLYTQYNENSARPVVKCTFDTNKAALKRIMTRLKAATIAQINYDKIDFTKYSRKTVDSDVRSVNGILKAAALKFYEKQGIKLVNPFKGIELGKIEMTPYSPLSQAERVAILKDCRSLPADQAITVILAFQLGLRKNEIDKARVHWLVKMEDHSLLCVQREDDFQGKTIHSLRNIPIPTELHEEILEIRNSGNPSHFDGYLLSGQGRGATRKDKTYRAVSQWLLGYGMKSKHRLHQCRKEFISKVMSEHNAGVAYKLAGHTDMELLMKVYGGLTKPPVIDFGIFS